MLTVVRVEAQHIALKKKVIPEWLLPPVVIAGLHTADQREAALVHRFSQAARQLRLLKRRALPS
jgi:hypothetical protein